MHLNDKHNRIYLSPPHMGGGELTYIYEAFNSNWIAPLGKNVDDFEGAIAEFCGVKYAAALSSGTSAIHLALIMLGVGSGDEVIAPSFTFSATINPIIYQGAKPVFIDSERETWNIDPNLLEKALKERAETGRLKRVKAILVVHLYGMPAKMDELMKVANLYNIPVVEDAAEALGSRYKGVHLGTFGKMGILSFNGNKIITTSGGGALISNDNELIQKARFLSTQARDVAPYYQHSEIGYNYRMSNVLAGIGRGQMEVLELRVERRRNIFDFYFNKMNGLEEIHFLKEPDERFFSNRWLTTIIIDPTRTKKSWMEIQRSFEIENIETRPLWKPMHLQPVFLHYNSYINGTSEELFSKGLCLPSGSSLSESDLIRIVNLLKKSLKV